MSKKVCVDAGHYGNYNQSPVNGRYYEAVRMWKLHEYLVEALKAYGITVVTTRSNQKKDLSLISRGKLAKGCDLFISLHTNAASAESVDYPVSMVFRKNNKSKLYELSEDIGLKLAKVVEDVMHTRQSARTATRGADTDRDGNGVKDDEYYGVLEGARQVGVPGVILEHSFHTNISATNWLMSNGNLKKLAEAEAKCIAQWLGIEVEKDGRIPDAWAKADVEWAINNKIIFGDGSGDLKLHKSCTRQELVVFMYRLYKNLIANK